MQDLYHQPYVVEDPWPRAFLPRALGSEASAEKSPAVLMDLAKERLASRISLENYYYLEVHG